MFRFKNTSVELNLAISQCEFSTQNLESSRVRVLGSNSKFRVELSLSSNSKIRVEFEFEFKLKNLSRSWVFKLFRVLIKHLLANSAQKARHFRVLILYFWVEFEFWVQTWKSSTRKYSKYFEYFRVILFQTRVMQMLSRISASFVRNLRSSY